MKRKTGKKRQERGNVCERNVWEMWMLSDETKKHGGGDKSEELPNARDMIAVHVLKWSSDLATAVTCQRLPMACQTSTYRVKPILPVTSGTFNPEHFALPLHPWTTNPSWYSALLSFSFSSSKSSSPSASSYPLHNSPRFCRKDEENALAPSYSAQRDRGGPAGIVSAPTCAYAASSVYSEQVPDSSAPAVPSHTSNPLFSSAEYIVPVAYRDDLSWETRPPSVRLNKGRKEEIVRNILGRNLGAVIMSQSDGQK